MDLGTVLKNLNVATLFFTPLLKDIAENINYKYSTTKFHMFPLFYEYGFISAYLYSCTSDSNKSLFLVFEQQEVIKKMLKTNKADQTLNNLLIGHKRFKSIESVDNLLIYEFALPEDYENDYILLKQGKYSKVSKEYKKMLSVSGFVLKQQFLKSPLGYFLIKNNFSHAVTLKEETVKNMFLHFFEVGEMDEDVELFNLFNVVKEYFSNHKLNLLNNGPTRSSDLQTVIYG